MLAEGISHVIENDTGFSQSGEPYLRRIGATGGSGSRTALNVGSGAMARGPGGEVCAVGRNARYSAPDFRNPDESILTCFDANGGIKWSKAIAGVDARVLTVDGLGIVTIAGATGADEQGSYARDRLKDGTQ